MKKLMFMLIILVPLAVTAPGHCFFDWLFSGGASRDAIDNSALGDLRAWWTGNPGYVFNPWWSGPSNPQAQQQGSSGAYGPQAPYPQMPQPNISYLSTGAAGRLRSANATANATAYAAGHATRIRTRHGRGGSTISNAGARLSTYASIPGYAAISNRTADVPTPSGVPSCTPDDATTRASARLPGCGRRSANGPAR